MPRAGYAPGGQGRKRRDGSAVGGLIAGARFNLRDGTNSPLRSNSLNPLTVVTRYRLAVIEGVQNRACANGAIATALMNEPRERGLHLLQARDTRFDIRDFSLAGLLLLERVELAPERMVSNALISRRENP